MYKAKRRTGMYFHCDSSLSGPAMVRAPQQTLPYTGKLRRQLIASGFSTPFSGSVSARVSEGTLPNTVAVPAGAFHTPRALSVWA
jgi:hypothetical protein